MNLFCLPEIMEEEEITEKILAGDGVVIERIISTGQASPEGFWYDQDKDEWVAVLQGRAKLAWEDGRESVLEAGDWVMLPAHEKHRVEWTSVSPACIWLAVFGNFAGPDNMDR